MLEYFLLNTGHSFPLSIYALLFSPTVQAPAATQRQGLSPRKHHLLAQLSGTKSSRKQETEQFHTITRIKISSVNLLSLQTLTLMNAEV